MFCIRKRIRPWKHAMETLLRAHCQQLQRNLCDPVMEDELRKRPQYLRFDDLENAAPIPMKPLS